MGGDRKREECFYFSHDWEPLKHVTFDGWSFETSTCVFTVVMILFWQIQGAFLSIEHLPAELFFLFALPAFSVFIQIYYFNYAWGYGEFGWFFYAKLYSVVVFAWCICARKRTTSGSGAAIRLDWAMCIMMVINVGEAVAKDFEDRQYLNSLAGFAIVYGIPSPYAAALRPHDKNTLGSPEHVVNFGLTLKWIILYSFWNVTFGYSIGKGVTSWANLMHPTSALILAAIKKEDGLIFWYVYRAFSFSIHVTTRVVFAPLTVRMMWVSIQNDTVSQVLGGMSLFLAICYAVSEWKCQTDTIGNLFVFKLTGQKRPSQDLTVGNAL